MLEIRRVTRVVAGGRRFSFSVTLVAGDRKGRVGVGIGKATDTTLAINKAFNDAKRNMIKVKTTESGSIPHEVTAKYNSGRVMLMPNKS
jgi:small subunit ribosomal protein S5